MNVIYHLSYIVGLTFIIGETLKRGFGEFAVNATTMFEDYLGGAILIAAALLWHKRHQLAPKMMIVAWSYSLGGLMVPFFAHLEAWLRGVTYRPDHPHEDIGAVITKGVLWSVCLVCVIVTVRIADRAFAERLASSKR